MFIQGVKLMLQSYSDIEIVDFALDGNEGLEKYEKYLPDIVLMDVNLPKLNGYEATIKIKAKYPNVKVIALTMLNDKTSVMKMLEAGVKGYLFKNANDIDLINAIKIVNQGEYFVVEDLKDVLDDFFEREKDRSNGYINFKKHELSIREVEILKWIMKGFTNQQIAETMILSPHTIDTHRKNMLAKLKLNNTAALIKYAMENKVFLALDD